ncbi:MAG: helix-turn-helix domain-containing protein [Limisphaerales bacterium]
MSDEHSSSETSQPRWFSIQEAAAYLEVTEPTLYRWMREKKITFRKVGDSTRFWREDLDAVMQVFHSERSVEESKNSCPICHSSEIVEGIYSSTGLNYFQPKKTKFWTLKASNIASTACMCRRCGAITLFGDTKKLNGLLEKSNAVEKL